MSRDDPPPEPGLAAMRRARAERAERLARLCGAAAPAAPRQAEDPAALAAFLRSLRAAISEPPTQAAPVPPPAPAPAAAAVLRFQRPPDRAPERPAERGAGPAAPPPGDLDRLPGAGPGLVWALERAGIGRLADLAASAPEALADRLGPIGGLIDLPAWIAFAKGAPEA